MLSSNTQTSVAPAVAPAGAVVAQPTRGRVAVPIVLLLLAILSWIPRLRGPIDLRWDGGVYYILGTSLAEGKGYRLLNEPGEIKATQYPPLLPLFIAAHELALGSHDPTVVGKTLRFSFFALYLASTFAIYVLALEYLPVPYAFGVTILWLTNFYVCFMSDSCFPELAFTLASVAFALLHRKKGRQFSILAALTASAAFALRTIGVALLAAWVCEGLLTKHFRAAAWRAALLLVCVLGWQLYIHSVESSTAYAHPAYAYQRAPYLFYNVSYGKNILLKDPFDANAGRLSPADLLRRSADNLVRLPERMGVALTSDKYFWDTQRKALHSRLHLYAPPEWTVDAALILLGSLVLCGIGIQLARREWFLPLYVFFYLAGLSLTPWPLQFTRYFAPLAPFLILALFESLRAVRRVLEQARFSTRVALGSIFVACVLSLILVEDALTFLMMYEGMHQRVAYVDRSGRQLNYRLFFYKDAYRALDGGLDWLRPRSRSEAVVASSMPHWVNLRTGLKSVMPPFETDAVKVQSLLDSVPVTYLIQDRGLDLDTRKYLSPVIAAFPERWTLIYSDSIKDPAGKVMAERFEIYERQGPLGSPAGR